MALGLLPMALVAWITPERAIDWSGEFVALVLLLGALATGGG